MLAGLGDGGAILLLVTVGEMGWRKGTNSSALLDKYHTLF